MTNPAGIGLQEMWRFCHDNAQRIESMQDVWCATARSRCATRARCTNSTFEAIARLLDLCIGDEAIQRRLKLIKQGRAAQAQQESALGAGRAAMIALSRFVRPAFNKKLVLVQRIALDGGPVDHRIGSAKFRDFMLVPGALGIDQIAGSRSPIGVAAMLWDAFRDHDGAIRGWRDTVHKFIEQLSGGLQRINSILRYVRIWAFGPAVQPVGAWSDSAVTEIAADDLVTRLLALPLIGAAT